MDRIPVDKHLDPSGFQELKKKSLAGMGALFVRQILIKVIFFVGNIVLARILAPELFGIYAIVAFVVQFFSTFGDVGIGAALIQKKGELTRDELSTTFWLQQMLVWLVASVIVFAAPLALEVYPTLPPAGVWLIRAMALSFILTSLKTIPAILMERNIDFNRIAWVDVAENLAFQVVAISCAFAGFGVWSFISASIARALCGAVIIYSLSPWRPGFRYHFDSVKALVRFGLPYQGNQILSFIKDAVTPLFVGAYAGAAAVGYVNWARNFAFAPLMISEGFARVAFPAFSKIQDDRELLARTVERSIRMITLVMFPLTAFMFALGPEITHLVFTDKWMPGIWAFYLYCTSPFVIGIMLPLYSAIVSIGKSDILLKMMVVLLVLEWGIGVPAVIGYGFVGISFSQPLLATIFFVVYRRVLESESVKITVFCNIRCQLLGSLLLGVLMKLAAVSLPAGVTSLVVALIVGFASYVGFMMAVNRRVVVEFTEYLTMIGGRGNQA